MIRKKAARKTDAYVSRETIEESDDDSDASDVGVTSRRRSSATSVSTMMIGERRISDDESEPRVIIEERNEDCPVRIFWTF